nr:unnamed protein product [Naegleria fowleri]
MPSKSSTPQPSNNSKVASSTNSSSEKVETPTTSPSPHQPSNVETSNDNNISDEFKTTAKHKENGNVEIYEATISSFSNDEKLLTKMLQLERQIMFYKECFKNTVISRVGLVSSSNLNLEWVEKIIEQHNGLFVNIQSFIENNTFSVVKEGHKPEID